MTVTAEMRRYVIERASNCCEYCLLSQIDNLFRFHIEHIIAEKHDGKDELDNLAWSCLNCNAFKGSDIGSLDPKTGLLTPLFNPRTQVWHEHFQLNGALIEPLIPDGRVTVKLLQMNRLEQLIERTGLIELGRYPCNR